MFHHQQALTSSEGSSLSCKTPIAYRPRAEQAGYDRVYYSAERTVPRELQKHFQWRVSTGAQHTTSHKCCVSIFRSAERRGAQHELVPALRAVSIEALIRRPLIKGTQQFQIGGGIDTATSI